MLVILLLLCVVFARNRVRRDAENKGTQASVLLLLLIQGKSSTHASQIFGFSFFFKLSQQQHKMRGREYEWLILRFCKAYKEGEEESTLCSIPLANFQDHLI
ncbi:hypothetical protein QBC32DRAFT_143083 [Pseudoneurospora amorphoporcata]|uniref:Uncharacterized protein n=1 Tax=Pseudoneurospora amorphoporcata TaxID=241081 RepID=A0AAN6SGJ0_9PEZI|nr:hypothetical protein QBC32DRAFT_143083 [Pseudoneurospora amorphoporcata]